ncbi:MAG: fructosamine kinase family protein [Acidimicrobiales bacterium]
MDETLRASLGGAVGRAVRRAERVHGGDVARSYRVELDDGGLLFAKTHPAAPAHFFTTEAAGLRWLREPAALAVPAVIAVSDGGTDGRPTADEPNFLVLEWIDEAAGEGAGGRHGEGTGHDEREAAFGAALAALHREGAPCFGRLDRRTTGSRGLPNDPCEDWATFYATRRLLPLARLARDGRALSERAIGELEALADRLGEVGGPAEPAARLHGDLWAGNRLVDRAGRSWLIDPAAHGGHREFDLAMMRLFGGFGPACFSAYAEVFPLADGWAQRIALHQVAPLVVHAIKFGGGYRSAAEAAISRYR